MERFTALVPGDLAVLRLLTAALMFATMTVAFVDVIGRYLFNAPIYGATEIIQMLMAGAIFGGLALVADQDGHIAVDLFEPLLHRTFGRPRRIVIGLVSAAGLLLIGVELWRIGMESLHAARATIVLGLPVAAMTLPGAVFCFLGAALQVNRSVIRK